MYILYMWSYFNSSADRELVRQQCAKEGGEMTASAGVEGGIQ